MEMENVVRQPKPPPHNCVAVVNTMTKSNMGAERVYPG